MEKLTLSDLNFILESLKYTKRKLEETPICLEGYPDYDFKQKRIKKVEAVTKKIQNILKEENNITPKEIKRKAAKEASNTFYNIMAASVKGNPKPVKKVGKKSPTQQDGK